MVSYSVKRTFPASSVRIGLLCFISLMTQYTIALCDEGDGALGGLRFDDSALHKL